MLDYLLCSKWVLRGRDLPNSTAGPARKGLQSPWAVSLDTGPSVGHSAWQSKSLWLWDVQIFIPLTLSHLFCMISRAGGFPTPGKGLVRPVLTTKRFSALQQTQMNASLVPGPVVGTGSTEIWNQRKMSQGGPPSCKDPHCSKVCLRKKRMASNHRKRFPDSLKEANYQQNAVFSSSTQSKR